jgi:hypothetical protein
MLDFAEVIRRVTAEHSLLREKRNLLGLSMNDMEAAINLTGASATWAQSSVGTIVERRRALQQTIDALEMGLELHFVFEENELPAILGSTLTHALLLEHKQIRDDIRQAKSALAETYLERLTREEVFWQKGRIQQLVFNASRAIEDHAGREDVILRMVDRSLQRSSAS